MSYSKSPWKSTFNSKKERGVRNSGGFICFLPKPNHYTGQDERYNQELMENEANAALIALSPDMLELLKDFVRAIENNGMQTKQLADLAKTAKDLIYSIPA
jgi:hypothetical protein